MVRSDKLWKLLNCVSQLQPKISQLSDQLQGFNLPFWKWEIITFTMEKVSASSCPPLLRKMQKTDRDFLVEKLSEIQDSQTSFNFHDWGRDSSQLKRFPLYWHGSLISKMYNWSSVAQRTVELWEIDGLEWQTLKLCLPTSITNISAPRHATEMFFTILKMGEPKDDNGIGLRLLLCPWKSWKIKEVGQCSETGSFLF